MGKRIVGPNCDALMVDLESWGWSLLLGAAGSFPGMFGMLVTWSSLSFSMEFYPHRGRLLLCRLPCKLSLCLLNSSSSQTSSSILLIFIFFVRLAKLLACNVVGI